MASWVKCTDATGVRYVNFDLVAYMSASPGGGSNLFFSPRGDENMTVNEPPEELIRLPDSFRR